MLSTEGGKILCCLNPAKRDEFTKLVTTNLILSKFLNAHDSCATSSKEVAEKKPRFKAGRSRQF